MTVDQFKRPVDRHKSTVARQKMTVDELRMTVDEHKTIFDGQDVRSANLTPIVDRFTDYVKALIMIVAKQILRGSGQVSPLPHWPPYH
jgi:hypothetical protein